MPADVKKKKKKAATVVKNEVWKCWMSQKHFTQFLRMKELRGSKTEAEKELDASIS